MGNKYTESQAKATKKYLKNIGECKIRIAPEKKKQYEQAAAAAGKSLNSFIVAAVDEKLEREGTAR